MWPPADATLAELEGWLETIRCLPADEVITAREGALEARVVELEAPEPKGHTSPLAFVLRAKQTTDKRRRQLWRFNALRDEFLAEEIALQLTIAKANATIETMERLYLPAGEVEHKLPCEYSASHDCPGRVALPDAADPASAASARAYGRDPDAAAGVSGIITQLLMLPGARNIPNMDDAYAAILLQARFAHADLTGNQGPTLEPVPPAQGRGAAEGGVCPPRGLRGWEGWLQFSGEDFQRFQLHFN